ncbi:NUMOD4 domain-containing protein [Clostridium chrysemydis]|uniref:NUMOD4 domain-containing protein n=1 Tax=Clostridium chrysemydis TaxID=2665504 RepID=UPI00188469E9|nr:NUMOD4 domain-containing protein [Clostridium chrysemydis]
MVKIKNELKNMEIKMSIIEKEAMFFIDMYTTAPNAEIKARALREIESRKMELEEVGTVIENLKEQVKTVNSVKLLKVSDLYNRSDKCKITVNEAGLLEIVKDEIIAQTVEIAETVTLDEKEFWKLVEAEEKKMADKSRISLVKEIFGFDISSIPNSKAKEIGEDEYVDLEKLTYEDEEIWKTIKSTKYQVSTLGRVRNSVTFEIVKPFKSNNIMIVKLDNSYLPLAGLIFSLFNKEVARDIEHIDNDITNNHILNLRKHEALVA